MKRFTYVLAAAIAVTVALPVKATVPPEGSASVTVTTYAASTTIRARMRAEQELRQTNVKEALRQENKTLIQAGVKENKDAVKDNRAEMKTNRQEAQSVIKDVRDATKEKLQAERERTQGVRAELKAEFQAKLETEKAKLAERQQARQQAVSEKKAELQKKLADRKAALSEQKQKQIQRLLDNTQKRFEAAIDRLNKLAIRIDSRIAKLDELGVNTVNAKSALVAARAQITLAQTKLDAAAVVSVEVAEGE